MGISKEKMLLEGRGDMSQLRREAEKTKESFSSFSKGAESAFTKLNQGLELAEKAIRGFKKLAEFGSFSREVERLGKVVNDSLVQKFVDATGGTISNLDAMRAATRAMTGQVKLSVEQLEVLFAAADNLSKRGFGPTVDIVDRLSKSLKKGETEAFREYGIAIDITKDKTKQMADAMRGLKDIAKDPLISDAALDSLDRMAARAENVANELKKRLGDAFNFILAKIGAVLEGFDNLTGERTIKRLGFDPEDLRDEVRKEILAELRRRGKTVSEADLGKLVSQGFGGVKGFVQRFGETTGTVQARRSGEPTLAELEAGIGENLIPPEEQSAIDAGLRKAEKKLQDRLDEFPVVKKLVFGMSVKPGATGPGFSQSFGEGDTDRSAFGLLEGETVLEVLRPLREATKEQGKAIEVSTEAQVRGAQLAIDGLGRLFGKEKEFARVNAIINVVKEIAMAKSDFAIGNFGGGAAHLVASAAWAKVAMTAGGGGGGASASIPGGGFVSAGRFQPAGGGGNNIVVQVGEGFVGDAHGLAIAIDERMRGARRAKRLNETSATSFD